VAVARLVADQEVGGFIRIGTAEGRGRVDDVADRQRAGALGVGQTLELRDHLALEGVELRAVVHDAAVLAALAIDEDAGEPHREGARLRPVDAFEPVAAGPLAVLEDEVALVAQPGVQGSRRAGTA
jgi:hypothetical protein